MVDVHALLYICGQGLEVFADDLCNVTSCATVNEQVTSSSALATPLHPHGDLRRLDGLAQSYVGQTLGHNQSSIRNCPVHIRGCIGEIPIAVLHH